MFTATTELRQAGLRSPLQHQDASPRPASLAGIFFTLAAVAIGYAIQVRDGEYWPAAIRWVGWALLLCTAGVTLPIGRERRWGWGAVVVALFGGLLLEFGLLLSASPGGANWWSNDVVNTSPGNFRVYAVLVRLAWVMLLVAFWAARTWGRYVFGVVLLIHLALGAWMIRASPRPQIDVFVFQQVGAQALLHGDNPYAIRYPDIYRETRQGDRPVYGVGLSQDGRLGFGFPYTPLSLLLSSAGYVLFGDHRYAQAIAFTAAGALLAFARPGRVGMLAATLLLFTPRWLFILGRGWTEPFVVCGLAAVVFVACRWGVWAGETRGPERTGARRWAGWTWTLPVVVGLFLGTKQYLVFALPAVWMLLPRGWGAGRTARFMAIVGIVAVGITLPLALWNLRAFTYSTWTVQQVAPFREDALSYLVWYFQKTGVHLTVAVAFAAMLLGIALAVWRAPRGPAGFAMTLAMTYLPFIAFNKQAFANYYLFAIGACCAAVAALPICADASEPGNSASSRLPS